VTLASYQGSNYDGQSLDEAIELKEAALRIFPELTEDERNRLGGELQKMYDAEVARVWDRVEYFQAKNAPQSVAVYCNILVNRFPDTVYAERARKILAAQGRRRRPTDEPDADSDAEAAAPEEKKPGFFPGLNWNFRKVQEDPPAEETDEPAEEEATERPSRIQQPAEEAEETEESEEQPPSGSRRSRIESASAGRATFD
jgi:hypothetical protein